MAECFRTFAIIALVQAVVKELVNKYDAIMAGLFTYELVGCDTIRPLVEA
jgi:hypothetical protein